jgi:predicted glycosyltransferase involved in capsule biosynthesis
MKLNEPLRSNDTRDTYIDTDLWEEFMKYAVVISSVAMINVPSFIEIGSTIQNLRGGGYSDTDMMELAEA